MDDERKKERGRLIGNRGNLRDFFLVRNREVVSSQSVRKKRGGQGLKRILVTGDDVESRWMAVLR